jgi:hypothetical protein
VRSLKDAGVDFEHCDLPGARRDGDIQVFGNFKAASFKDPRRQFSTSTPPEARTARARADDRAGSLTAVV